MVARFGKEFNLCPVRLQSWLASFGRLPLRSVWVWAVFFSLGLHAASSGAVVWSFPPGDALRVQHSPSGVKSVLSKAPGQTIGRVWLVHEQPSARASGSRGFGGASLENPPSSRSKSVAPGPQGAPAKTDPTEPSVGSHLNLSQGQVHAAVSRGVDPVRPAPVAKAHGSATGEPAVSAGATLASASALAPEGEAAKKVARCLSLRPAAAQIPQELWEDLRSYAMLPRRYDVAIAWSSSTGKPTIQSFRAVGAPPSHYIDGHLRGVLAGCLAAANAESVARGRMLVKGSSVPAPNSLEAAAIETISVRIAFEDGTRKSVH